MAYDTLSQQARHLDIMKDWVTVSRREQDPYLTIISSLGLFSSRLYKIYKLGRQALNSDGAVEGILAAAVLYTIIVGLLNLCLRAKSAPNFLRWLLIALDLAFVGAFIAVTVLTRPNGKSIPTMIARYHTSSPSKAPTIGESN